MKKKLYQLFIAGTGPKLEEALKKNLGGIIYFQNDFKSANELLLLCEKHKASAITSPFLSIDQEGGRVQRLKETEYISAYEAQKFGLDFVYEQNKRIAKELKKCFMNLNFAPVCDVNTNPNNPIIGSRAFSNDPKIVSLCVKKACEASISEGIIPCLKHFPGHGDTNCDSHKVMPEVILSKDELEKNHIFPFKENIEAPFIMFSHVHYHCFDKNPTPASCSKNIINFLRKELKYNGIIISDDMKMGGAFGLELKDMILNGVNMFIFRDCDNELIKLIEKIDLSNPEISLKVEESYKRIIELKKKFKIL